MYTAEDIRNIMFTKSMGGYKTGEVDLFIDQCADTVEALTNANAEQEKKLEMLAEKLMEYRKDEDNIHTALLSAQRAGDALLREAQQKADLILKDAAIKAENVQDAAERDIRAEKEALQKIKDEVADFKKQLLDMYRQHLTLIDALPAEQPAEEEAPAEEDALPETPVSSASPEREAAVTDLFSSSENEPSDSDEPEQPETESQPAEEEAPAEDAAPETPPEAETAAKPPIAFNALAGEREVQEHRFSDLQFGPEYEIDRESRRRLFGRRKDS